LLLACQAQTASPEQLFQEAVAAQRRGDDDLAIRNYRQLLKLYPDAAEVRANLGAVLAKQGKLDEAIEQYRVVLSKSPDNPPLRLNLALAYYKKEALPEAIRELTRVYKADTSSLQVALLLADCYLRTAQPAAAVSLLTPLEAAHREELSLQYMLGTALIRTQQKAQGLQRVEAVGRRSGNPQAFLLAGQTALELDYFERARDLAEAGLRIDPKLAGLLTLRGRVRNILGDNDGALSDLRAALQQDASDFEAHLALGAVLHTERQLEESRRHLQRALELDPKSSVARYQMAKLERTEGHAEQALRHLEAVVKADPNWAQPHIELAALYFQMNRQAEGEKHRAIFDRLNAQQSPR
jgi:tetratricopeptide (TPR) repeat protein